MLLGKSSISFLSLFHFLSLLHNKVNVEAMLILIQPTLGCSQEEDADSWL